MFGLKNIKWLWFKNVNFEIYLWDKFNWKNNDFNLFENQIKMQKSIWIFEDLNIINLLTCHGNHNFLDISTSWKIWDNSLEFFNENIDFSPKILFNNIFKNL